MSASDWASPTRPARKSAGEVRVTLLQAGVDMLSATGLTVSLQHLNMEELIRTAGVPRSSVYRLWGNRESFFTDLMIELLAPERMAQRAFDPQTLTVAQEAIDRYRELLNTREGRRQVLCEVVRVGVRRNFEAVTTSTAWRTFAALSATLASLPADSRRRVLAALREAEDRFASRMTEFYETLFPLVGIRPRQGVSTRNVVIACASVVSGFAERAPLSTHYFDPPLLLAGPEGEPVEWLLVSVAVLGVLDSLTEEAA